MPDSPWPGPSGTVGSVFNGYVGGSTNCLSTVAAGTGELSEAESSNVIALAKEHSNIRYAMHVHSYDSPPRLPDQRCVIS